VKPRRGVASKGVKLLTTLDHLQRYVAAAKSKALLEKLIFEKYIDGDEFSIEAFTLEGTTKIYSITQKYNIDAVEFDFGFCNGLAQRYGPVCQEAIDLLFARLEVRTGPTHTEVKIDAHGTVRVIETHTRVAGDFVPEMVRVISGVDLYALTVREACGQLRTLPEPERRPIAAALKYKRYDPGKVVSARGESSLRFRPDILAYSLKSRPGVKLRKAESNFDRTDYVACHAPTLAEAYARCDHYLEYVSVATAS
jgi:biotin carboxylase